MANLPFNKLVYLDFHTHKSRYKGNDKVVEIVSFHLGMEHPHEGLYTIGKHPWWTDAVLTIGEVAELTNHFNSTNCLALGEMGLDKLKGSPLAVQMDILRSQLSIAAALNAPVIIHCVRAYNQLLQIKKEFPSIKKWCVHGFGRNVTLAQQLVNEGFYLSLMPNIRPIDKLNELLHGIPRDRLFLETDSMSQISIEDIYLQASKMLNIPLEELQVQMMQNASNFFGNE